MLRKSILKRLIDYNPETGLVLTECEVSLQAIGHTRIIIKGISYRLIEVLWFMSHGAIEQHTSVVQINNYRLDFRMNNLKVDNTKLQRIQNDKDKAEKKKLKKEAKEKALRDKVDMDDRFKERRLSAHKVMFSS